MKKKLSPVRALLLAVAILSALAAIGIAVHSHIVRQRASGSNMQFQQAQFAAQDAPMATMLERRRFVDSIQRFSATTLAKRPTA